MCCFVVFLCSNHFFKIVFVQLTHKAGMTKKRAAPVETGTTQKREVDFEWIPREIVKAGQ